MRDSGAANQYGFAATATSDTPVPSERAGSMQPVSLKPGDTVCVFNLNRESFLSLSVKPADTHLSRLRGLLGRSKLRSDEGLWTVPSQGIHTIFLLFPIDLIYLDAKNRVIHLVENLGPFRIAPIRMDSASVLQLRPRTIFSSDTQIGDDLLIGTPQEIELFCKDRHTVRGER